MPIWPGAPAPRKWPKPCASSNPWFPDSRSWAGIRARRAPDPVPYPPSGASMPRIDGRKRDELRPIKITEDFVSSAEASYLIEVGKTRILCCASLEEELPRWLKGKNKGWVTAEYNLL